MQLTLLDWLAVAAYFAATILAGLWVSRRSRSVEGYTGCISGALMKGDYLDAIRSAGFSEVRVVGESRYPIGEGNPDETEKALFGDVDVTPDELRATAEAVVSLKVAARKA